MFLFVILSLFALYVNGDICTPASTCVITRCPGCSVVTVAFYQTDPKSGATFVAFNVSNQCSKTNKVPGVISVDFNIDSPRQGLTLSPSLRSGSVYQGSNYQWDVAYRSPQGTDSLPGSKPTRYIRFSARGSGVSNGHQTGMVMPNPLNYEIFKFSVTGYDPIYDWVFRIHYGTQYEVHGYTDISTCFCDSCDSKHQKQIVTPCTLGYPSSTSSRSPTIFNEDLILYSFAVTGKYISLYYSDEFPLMLGLGYVRDLNKPIETVGTLSLPIPQTPVCIYDPDIGFGSLNYDPTDLYGAVDNSGEGNRCNPGLSPTYSCPRPLPPSLYLTDITSNPNSKAGDWQLNGTLYLPDKICGLYYYTQKDVKSPRIRSNGEINANILGFYNMPLTLPQTNTILKNKLPPWDFGVGADPIPVYAPLNSATNRYEYGVQIGWDYTKLPLKDSHNYRFQIMAHDGDSTKTGGDIGQACVNIIVQCDAGFTQIPGTDICSVCDTLPLPGDGKWTWFCSPRSVPLPGADSGIVDPYFLSKIPKSKLDLNPYKTYIDAGTGFIPKEGFLDKDGFAISCDCKRTIKPCPLNCCGNGKCDFTKGVCTCNSPPAQLINVSTCCPTIAPTKAPTPPPTPAPTPVPLKCPNDCCSRVICNTNLGVCACPAPFNAPPYNGTDCCLLPTPAPTKAPTPAPTTPAPTIFLAPTEAPTPPTNAPTGAPTNAPTELPCYNNGLFCNGNGVCNTSVPVCVCVDPFFGSDCSNFTLAPTTAPTDPPPCFNEGKFCNGNGNCVNGTCVCDDPIASQPACTLPPCYNGGVYCNGRGNCTNGTCVCDDPLDLQPACAKPPLPPPTCADVLNGSTCEECLAGAVAIGLKDCTFCPENITLPTGEVVNNLEKGVCSKVCSGPSLATCQPLITVIPPVCPDNCSGNGLCVNLTVCDRLAKENFAKYGNDTGKYPLDCGENANESRLYNQTGACACIQGFVGLNCALIGKISLVAIAALGAGLIALIIILALLGAAMAGGGAAAVSSGVASTGEATVVTSPLYEASQAAGDNPLFDNTYEMM